MVFVCNGDLVWYVSPEQTCWTYPCTDCTAVLRHVSTAGADTKAAKFFINCLAEEAHVVADALVPRIRKIPYESKGSGGGGGGSTYIRYLTKQKAYTQILGRLIGGRRKNRYVQEE